MVKFFVPKLFFNQKKFQIGRIVIKSKLESPLTFDTWSYGQCYQMSSGNLGVCRVVSLS